jgi:hypothetical protein
MKFNKIHIIGLLLLILNSYDIIVLIIRTVGLGEFESVICFIISIIVLIYLFKLINTSLRTILLLFIILLYLNFQLYNGLYYPATIDAILPSYIGIFTLMYLVMQLKTFSNNDIYKLLKIITFGSVIVLISFDILNLIVKRNSLMIVIQNDAPLLILSLLIIYITSYDKYNSKRSLKYFYLFLLWMPISYVLAQHSTRLQIKSLAFTILIIMIIFLLNKLKIFIPKLKTNFSIKIAPIIYLMLIVIPILIIAPIVLDYTMHSFGRSGSGIIRLAVAQVMTEELMNTKLSLLFGYGLGSSNQEFFIGDHTLGIATWTDAKSHSGIMTLFFEHGIVGLLFASLLLLNYIYRKKIFIVSYSSKLSNHKGLVLLLLLLTIGLWIVQNVIYVIGIPATYPFHHAQLPLYLVLLAYLSNLYRERILKIGNNK